MAISVFALAEVDLLMSVIDGRGEEFGGVFIFVRFVEISQEAVELRLGFSVNPELKADHRIFTVLTQFRLTCPGARTLSRLLLLSRNA